MLVRYYVADRPAVLRGGSIAEREARCQRAEAVTTLAGGLILLVMLALLVLAQG